MSLDAQVSREVNQQRDENGLTYVRKTIIRTRMALNVNRQWQVDQLSPGLQGIVNKHRGVFEDRKTIMDSEHSAV